MDPVGKDTAKLPLRLCLEGNSGKLGLHHFCKCHLQKLRFLAKKIANNGSGRNSMFSSTPCYSNQDHRQITPLRHLPCGALLPSNARPPGPVPGTTALRDPHVTTSEAEESQTCLTGRTEQTNPFATPFCCNVLKYLHSDQAADVLGSLLSTLPVPACDWRSRVLPQ